LEVGGVTIFRKVAVVAVDFDTEEAFLVFFVLGLKGGTGSSGVL
jgi:hypothetical protein